jgi:hypothetical protein
LLELGLIVLGAALPVAASWSLGRWLFRDLHLPSTLAFVTGAALLSAAIFVMLILGQARPPLLTGLALLCLAPLWFQRPVFTRPDLPPWWSLIPMVAFGGLYVIHALAPETQTDALNYHLMLPVEASRSGGFPRGVSFYNLIPQGLETLFALAYAIGGDSSVRLLHLTFLGVTVLLVQWVAERFGESEAGWPAGTFYAVTPVVGMASVCAFNDAAIACYTLATFALMLQWWRKQQDQLLLAAGLCAGFCYAIKFTGGIVAPVAFFAILLRTRRMRSATLWLAGVFAMAVPWVARAAILTGNPFAPLLNRFFPNPYFRIESEQVLAQYLRSYGEVEWGSIGQELAFYGDLLQGVLGPVWLAAPLAILALRRRGGRVLLGIGLIAALPWLLNIGVRFLMPALPFVALAWMFSIPKAVRAMLLLAHAALSWPSVLALYTPPASWALTGELPWRAALRIESRESYLQRRSEDWNIAQMVQSHTRPDDGILDLAGAPAAITPRTLRNAWQTAAGENMVRALQLGATPDRGLMVEWRSRFPEVALDAIRIDIRTGQVLPAGIHEVRLMRKDGAALKPDALWTIEAEPNIWEAPMALDRMLVTAWWTWEPVRAGMYYQVELPARESLAEIRIIGHRSAASLGLTLSARAGSWTELPIGKPVPRAGLNLRSEAIGYLRKQGITHILAQSGTDGYGILSQNLISQPQEWNVKIVASYKGAVLLKIDPYSAL